MRPVNLTEKQATFLERWSPKIVSAFHGRDVTVAEADASSSGYHPAPDMD